MQNAYRDYKNHSAFLAGKVFACLCQPWIADRDKLESWRWALVFGLLLLVSLMQGARLELVLLMSTWTSRIFSFLSVFSTNSKYVWCLDFGIAGFATRPSGTGARGSNITL